MDIENFIKTIQQPVYKRMIKIPEHVAKIFGIENILVITGEFTHITQILTPDKDVILSSEMCKLLDCSPYWQGLSIRDLIHNRETIYSSIQSKNLHCDLLKKSLEIVYNIDANNKELANSVLINISEILARSFRKYFECPFPIVTHPSIKENGEMYIIYEDDTLICGIKELNTCKKIVNRLNIIVQASIDLNTLHNDVNSILFTNRKQFTHRPIYRLEILKFYKLS